MILITKTSDQTRQSDVPHSLYLYSSYLSPEYLVLPPLLLCCSLDYPGWQLLDQHFFFYNFSSFHPSLPRFPHGTWRLQLFCGLLRFFASLPPSLILSSFPFPLSPSPFPSPLLSSLPFRFRVCVRVCSCVCVYVFIKLHITTQSDPVILAILCHSPRSSQGRSMILTCVCVCVFCSQPQLFSRGAAFIRRYCCR